MTSIFLVLVFFYASTSFFKPIVTLQIENESSIDCLSIQQAVAQLADCGRLFHSRGWSVGTSSNYSAVVARAPLQICITASGMDKGRLGEKDFVIVDPRGNPTSDDQPKSSAETMLHCVLAEKDNQIGSVLHTHSVWGTLLSDRFFNEDPSKSGFWIEGFEMLKGLEGIKTHESRVWVPIFENTQDIPSLASKVNDYFDGCDHEFRHGYLIRKHGLYTWGKSVQEARRHIEIYEFLFEVLGRQLSMTPKS